MKRELYVRFWTSFDDEAVEKRLRGSGATMDYDGALWWNRHFGVPAPHDDGDELVLGLIVEDAGRRRSVRKGVASESPPDAASVGSGGKGPLPDKGGGEQ